MRNETPHPELVPLLEKHGISYEAFCKMGRPAAGVSEKRRNIVTELHSSGMTWARMSEILGKPISFIQRNTNAMWNDASRENRRQNAAEIARSRKGERKPWLSERMREAWKSGEFDFHRGRIRPAQELRKLRDAWTPERRKRISERRKELWQDIEYRQEMESFHRSPEERAKRSRAQVNRMVEHPGRWSRGRGCWLTPKKCSKGRIWVRSSYERRAVELLDADDRIISYEYERRIAVDEGKEILPDFVVHYKDRTTLVEVKARWVLTLPETDKRVRRLRLAEMIAGRLGWDFKIWTESELGLC